MTYLDIAMRGRNTLWRYIVAWPAALLLWLILVSVVLLPLMLSHVISADQLQPAAAATYPVPFFALQGMIFAGLIAGFTAAAFLLHKKTFGDLCGSWRWTHVLTGAVIWLVALTAITAIDYVLQPGGFTLTIGKLTPAFLATVMLCLVVQTFAEEFIFRGYLTQSLLLATKRPVAASVIAALAFGALHIPNGIPQAVNATVMGAVFSLIAIRTGSLAFGWGIHLVNNLFGSVVVVSANDVFSGTPAVFTQNTPGLMWWDTLAGVTVMVIVCFVIMKDRRFSASADQYPK